MLDGAVEQVVDSTPMLGAAAVDDMVTLVRTGVRKLLDAVRALDAPAAERLRAALAFDYARPARGAGGRLAGHGRARGDAGQARRGRAPRSAVERDAELLAEEAIGEAVRLLREIVAPAVRHH